MISLILTLIVLGVVFYFIEMIPMSPPFVNIIRAVSIILAVVLVLKYLNIPLNF